MEVGRVTQSSDDLVKKSPNDKRLYRYIELSNGLCALLVHDPEICLNVHTEARADCQGTEDEEEDDESGDEDDEEDDDEQEEDETEDESECGEGNGDEKKKDSHKKAAAAAMCVGMGSFSDPCEAQGLAHFLEHMLFMGSTEFPDENEYHSYFSKHGGWASAFTETECTCYRFEVQGEFLHGALKRFSQFFVSPLLKAETMERELLAVDSGNKKSLGDAMEKGVKLREQIFKLYNDNYYGKKMKLVIIGGETLNVLESWALELFSTVKGGDVDKSGGRLEFPIWKPGKLYRLEAVNDVHILHLLWPLPTLRKDYMRKPEYYLGHLLGHESRGSLLFFLKAKGWATYISAGVDDKGMHRSSLAYIFEMLMHLTDSGLKKIFEIIGLVYQYIKLLRQVSPQQWIFNELQNIGHMEFRFIEEIPQDKYAAKLAGNLLVYPPEDVVYGDYAFEVWDEQLIRDVLGFFTVDNMTVDIVTKLLNDSIDIQHEPWFGSRYIEEEIPLSLLELWKDPPEIDESLHLPDKNEFIASDFSIRADVTSCDGRNVSAPKCIIDEPLMKFWYKLDTSFKNPRADTFFRIALKGAYSDLKSALLTELFVLLLEDELNGIVYMASVAKLETSVSLSHDTLMLKVYGFNDKLPVLLSKVLAATKSFSPKDDRFLVIKEDMERTLKNTNMKPLDHSSYLRLQVLCQSFWDVEEKQCLLHNLCIADLKAFLPDLFSQVYIDGVCRGNLSEEEAVNITNIFKSYFLVPPLPGEMIHREFILCLPSGADLVRDVPVKNKLETNSVVELYYQVEPEEGSEFTKLKALLDLFDEIVEEPLFTQLRTKEQLGYVVDCCPRVTNHILGFCFRVQSSEYDPVYLQGRVDNFINSVKEILDDLNDVSFQNYKSGLVAKLLEKDPSHAYQTNRLWGQIIHKRYMFDMPEKEAEELKTICKSDLIEWYMTYLQQPSPKCRRLSVRVWGCHTEQKTATEPAQIINNLAAFKESSQFYPRFV